MLYHIGLACIGVLLIVLGIATFLGRVGREPSARWFNRRLVGAADSAIGIAFVLLSLLAHQLWALLLGITSFVVACGCVGGLLIRGMRGRANDQLNSR